MAGRMSVRCSKRTSLRLVFLLFGSGNDEACSALRPAAFEDCTSANGRVALAETMRAVPLDFARLICRFSCRHAQTPYRPLSVSTQWTKCRLLQKYKSRAVTVQRKCFGFFKKFGPP